MAGAKQSSRAKVEREEKERLEIEGLKAERLVLAGEKGVLQD